MNRLILAAVAAHPLSHIDKKIKSFGWRARLRANAN